MVNGARLIACPPRSVLFETADGGGVVDWQKLILCCGGASCRCPFPAGPYPA